jgi:zinc protease
VHGDVYNVSSSVNAGKVRGTFSVQYGCDPQNIVPAQGQVIAVLKQLQQQPIEPDRILRSKALLMGRVPLREASYEGMARELLSYAVEDLPLNEGVVEAGAELASSASALQAAIAKYVRPDAFVRVVTGPPPP